MGDVMGDFRQKKWLRYNRAYYGEYSKNLFITYLADFSTIADKLHLSVSISGFWFRVQIHFPITFFLHVGIASFGRMLGSGVTT